MIIAYNECGILSFTVNVDFAITVTRKLATEVRYFVDASAMRMTPIPPDWKSPVKPLGVSPVVRKMIFPTTP